jgi:flagellar assembly protein FliH
LSKILKKGDEAGATRDFSFNSFDDQVESERMSVEDTFVKDAYSTTPSEFVPGGFDFNYKGGLRRDEILSHSLDEANLIIEESRGKAEIIKQEAHAEGFDVGHKEGYQRGLIDAQPVIESFQKVINELLAVRAGFYDQAESEMIDLVITVAKTVISQELEANPSLVQKVVLSAVEQLRVRERMTIRVNPADFAEAEKTVPELSKEIEDIEKLSFKSDPLITRGGCLVETNIGMIDARLETQLEAIRQSFKDAMEMERVKKSMGEVDQPEGSEDGGESP